jgi:hypothetical protein
LVATKKDMTHASQIIAGLAGALRVTSKSLCFCGVGNTFEDCCGSSAGDNRIFVERALAAADAYVTSKGGTIKSVPAGIWNGFAKASQRRLRCLFPGCTKTPVSCHLIPENVLRANFGDHCKEFKIEDGLGMQFKRTGIGTAGCLDVFCAEHDHALFDPIDRLTNGPFSEEQSFLLALKVMAFSLRKIQLLLAVDSQLEILRPLRMIEKSAAGGNHKIDVSRLQRNYIGFTYAMAFYREAMSALSLKNWSHFKHFYRSMKCSTSLFFSTFRSFSHDLKGRPIDTTNSAIGISCNIFACGGNVHVLLSCPGELMAKVHRDFFNQLALANDETFKAVLNVILTWSIESILVPQSFSVSANDRRKIKSVQAHAIGSQGALHNVANLADAQQAVKFLR